ncbi:MAG: hypothetical protein LBR28_07220, partial [Bacteroidales bacterium]|nr:hypothetical protein [Bacteroidales bacterium]
ANSEDNNCLYITTKDGEYILFDNDGNYDEISYICFYALVAEKYLCEYQFGTSGWEEPEERNTFVSKYINYIFQIPLKGQINDNGIEECFNRVYYDFVKTNTSIERVDQGYNFREYNVGKEYYLILGTFCSWAKTFVITADDNGWLCVKYI